MGKGQIIAIDFDHTLWDTFNNRPMQDAHYALDAIHDAGHKVLIHSCNNPEWIRAMCAEHNLRVDYIWGETGLEGGKPVWAIYVDDRAQHFQGNWREEMDEIRDRVSGRGVKDFKGPVYQKNPTREEQLRKWEERMKEREGS